MKSEILLSRLSELCGRNAAVAARELDEYSLMIREASVKMNLLNYHLKCNSKKGGQKERQRRKTLV